MIFIFIFAEIKTLKIMLRIEDEFESEDASLKEEILQITEEILADAKECNWPITPFEAMQIAVKIQKNRILSGAYVVSKGVPSALEKFVMTLEEGNPDIGESLSEIAEAIKNHSKKE